MEHVDGRLDELLQLVNSGPRVPWEQSIRGRLHEMKTTLATTDKLAEAAREVRRARRSTLSGFERLLLVACAIVAAATPYVILLTR